MIIFLCTCSVDYIFMRLFTIVFEFLWCLVVCLNFIRGEYTHTHIYTYNIYITISLLSCQWYFNFICIIIRMSYLSILIVCFRLLRRAGIERELASRADQRVLRWFGHVERMDEYRMARRALMAEISGGWVRGRPRLGWMDGVKVALGNRGMTVEAAPQCAKDRKEGRAIYGTYVTK